MKLKDNPEMKEVCGNCGCTFGSHHGSNDPWPIDYCPGDEGRMNWDKGPGTVFKPIDPEIEKINNMSHLEMARLWRFCPSGHPYFDTSKPYFNIFEKRFREFGGWTSEISKQLG